MSDTETVPPVPEDVVAQPHDRMGEPIEVGADVVIFGGGRGTVASLDFEGQISVRRDDGKMVVVLAGNVTVLDGSTDTGEGEPAPTTDANPDDKPATVTGDDPARPAESGVVSETANPDGAFAWLVDDDATAQAWLRIDEAPEPVGYVQSDVDDPATVKRYEDIGEWTVEVDSMGLHSVDDGRVFVPGVALFTEAETKRLEAKRDTFKEVEHPRDRIGRFIETGAEVRIWGGALGKVIESLPGGRVRVEKGDGARVDIDAGNVTVIKSPDGTDVEKASGESATAAVAGVATTSTPDATPDGAYAHMTTPDGHAEAWLTTGEPGGPAGYIRPDVTKPETTVKFDDAQDWAAAVDTLKMTEDAPATPATPAAPDYSAGAAEMDKIRAERVGTIPPLGIMREGAPDANAPDPTEQAIDTALTAEIGKSGVSIENLSDSQIDHIVEAVSTSGGHDAAEVRRRLGTMQADVPNTPVDETSAPDASTIDVAVATSKGRPDGAGTADDPIDVEGDIFKAAKLITEGKHVRLNQPDEVATLLDHMAELVNASVEKGEQAPNFNLCQVSVRGANLFCGANKGIARVNMPQLKGKPLPGSPADLNGQKDGKGRVDISAGFHDWLTGQGIGVTSEKRPASHLRATQMEINGPLVASLVGATRNGEVPKAATFITRDGYIIDGHHRWAADVAIDAADGKLGDAETDVEVLDLDIGAALDLAHRYAREQGIPPKSVDTPPTRTPGTPPPPNPARAGMPGPSGDFEADSVRVLDNIGTQLEAKTDTESVYDHIDGHPGKWTAEREAQQDAIIDHFLGLGHPKAENKALVLGGLPGAGKTTFLNSDQGQTALALDMEDYVVVNPDEVKTIMMERGMVPDYEGLTSDEAATLFHEESTQIAQDVMHKAMSQGLNVVYDTSLKKTAQVNRIADTADAVGQKYDTTVVFIDVPVDTAKERAIHRYSQGGRFIPLDLISSMATPADYNGPHRSLNGMAFEDAKTAPGVTAWLHVDNLNEDGTGPKILGAGGGLSDVLNQPPANEAARFLAEQQRERATA